MVITPCHVRRIFFFRSLGLEGLVKRVHRVREHLVDDGAGDVDGARVQGAGRY